LFLLANVLALSRRRSDARERHASSSRSAPAPGQLYHSHVSGCYDRGMSSVGHKILQDVLALPENERAEIAARLIESLDNDADAGVDEAWAAEIERRCAALDAGEAVTSDWEDVRRRIETQLLNK
jgi:putative addiction module component (TIGR02574 family)